MLFKNGRQFCGGMCVSFYFTVSTRLLIYNHVSILGSLIDSTHILTAAHCVAK